MAIILKNVTRRPFVGNLDHASLRHVASDKPEHARLAFRPMKVRTVDHLANGELYVRHHAKSLPESITIFAGEKSELLPDVVKECTDVANAIRRGELVIASQFADEPAPAAKKVATPDKSSTIEKKADVAPAPEVAKQSTAKNP